MSSRDVEEQVQDNRAPLNDPSSRAAFLQRAYPPLPPSLLHSSSIPSPDEEITIRETIRDINTTLSSVDDEISRVRATLSALEAYHSTLRTTLAHQHAALSPIRRLPPEILGEIFVIASSSFAAQWPKRKSRPRNSEVNLDLPWLLCQICSYWRTVAVSVPRLWSNIRVNFLRPLPRASENVLDFIGLCLSRSKNELLTLSYEARGWWCFLPDLDTLITHCERWKDVSLIDSMLFSGLSALLGVKSLRVPNLWRLHIDAARYDYEPDNISPSRPLEAFEDAPNLRELSLTDIVHPMQYLRIPWSQLTHLSSKGSVFAEGEFTQIIRHMTGLISFSTEGERILEVASTEPVLLPHLRKLSIINKGSYISKTCQFLTAPNLEELTINAVTPFIAEQTVAMIERSGCKPKNLILRSSLDASAVRDENTNVVWVLAAVPELTCLELTVANAAVIILPRLANRSGRGSPPAPHGPPLIPSLEKLVLEDRLCMSALEITDVLEWRIMNGVRPPGLRSIDLRLYPPVPPDFFELRLFKGVAQEHGVEISVFPEK